jgi:hypothetical protein
MKPKIVIFSASIFGVISFFFASPESYAQAHTKGRVVAPFTSSLKPGEYTWHPELSPAGPVVVLVSLPDPVRPPWEKKAASFCLSNPQIFRGIALSIADSSPVTPARSRDRE